MIQSVIKQAVKAIKQSEFIFITTGAGMGVDSGLPDYRGNQGFWNSFPPYSQKFTFIQCASPSFLNRHPNLFWGFYGTRLKLYRQTQPHQGYEILKNFVQDKKGYFAVTSNVDGHLNKYFLQNTWQVHGRITFNQCTKCGKLNNNLSYIPLVDNETMSCDNIPLCGKCKGVERPNVLMFGDGEWDSDISDQQEEKFKKLVNKARDERVVIIEIGAGEYIPTIRNIGEGILRLNKQYKMIRINPQDQQGIKRNVITLQKGALQALTLLHQNY